MKDFWLAPIICNFFAWLSYYVVKSFDKKMLIFFFYLLFQILGMVLCCCFYKAMKDTRRWHNETPMPITVRSKQLHVLYHPFIYILWSLGTIENHRVKLENPTYKDLFLVNVLADIIITWLLKITKHYTSLAYVTLIWCQAIVNRCRMFWFVSIYIVKSKLRASSVYPNKSSYDYIIMTDVKRAWASTVAWSIENNWAHFRQWFEWNANIFFFKSPQKI